MIYKHLIFSAINTMEYTLMIVQLNKTGTKFFQLKIDDSTADYYYILFLIC